MKKNEFPETDVCAVSHPADFRPEYRRASDACQAYFTGLSANLRIVRRLISVNAIRRLGRMLAACEGGRTARYRQNLPGVDPCRMS